jgi:hypothetical protein
MSQPSAAPPRTTIRPQVVVVVLALGGIVVSLMQTLVIPLIPKLPGLLGASVADTAWVITATLLGALVVAAGYGLGAVLMSEVWQLVLVSGTIGAGIGLAYGAMPALIMGAVPVSETAAANSLNTLMRAIGTSISSAVAGVILAQLTISFGSVAVPSQGGFRLIMVLGCGTALAALAIAAFIPGVRGRVGTTADDRRDEVVTAGR